MPTTERKINKNNKEEERRNDNINDRIEKEKKRKVKKRKEKKRKEGNMCKSEGSFGVLFLFLRFRPELIIFQLYDMSEIERER